MTPTPVLQNTAAKFAVISASSIGDNTIVAAQGPGKKIRVLSYVIVAKAATSARFESAAGGTALTGVMALTTNNIISAAYNPFGHLETLANELLNLETSADGLYGHLTYVVIENPPQP